MSSGCVKFFRRALPAALQIENLNVEFTHQLAYGLRQQKAGISIAFAASDLYDLKSSFELQSSHNFNLRRALPVLEIPDTRKSTCQYFGVFHHVKTSPRIRLGESHRTCPIWFARRTFKRLNLDSTEFHWPGINETNQKHPYPREITA